MTVDTDTPWFIRSSAGRTDTDLDRLFIRDVIWLARVTDAFRSHGDELKQDLKGITPEGLTELVVDAEDLLEDMGFYVVDDPGFGYEIYKEA